ncbi:sigma 54-interacting transcriptional regulator [bacterium 210820-DFI.6.37]|nr:sigma 54-interacting transcriptional regulator [bacterium 210820-DFI.6.37]
METNHFKMFDDIQEIVLIENEGRTIEYVNRAFCRCHGVTLKEAVGRSCFDFIIPEDRETCSVEHVVTPENPYYRTIGRSKHIDDKIIWIQYVGRAYFDDDNNCIGFQETGVDITEWKEKIEARAKRLAKVNQRIEKEIRKDVTKVKVSSGMDCSDKTFPIVHEFSDIYTANTKMKSVISYAKAVAAGGATILVEGESGTGKELFAQAIHSASKRSNGPFVTINCGVTPPQSMGNEFFGYTEGAFDGAAKGGKPGKFEMASGGTLFLDEIDQIPLAQQAALMRILETKSVSRIGDDKEVRIDVRIVCATDKNLYREVKEGRFRSDLYYRLNVINLYIPPLRERKEDIYLLIGVFIKKYGSHHFYKEKAFSDKKLTAFYEYDWPGNVRELRNVVERLIYMPDKDNDMFFEYMIRDFDHKDDNKSKKEKENKPQDEKQKIINFIEMCEGNISMVSRKMGISRNTLYKKLKKYNIKY